MNKTQEALKLALEALEYIYEGANNQGPHTGISWRCVSKKAAPVITAIREALADSALDRMAENARELGLDYEPPCKTGSQCTSKCQQCEQPAQQQEPVAWRELCRRLYVELFHCDQQMMATLDEDGEPIWTQGKTVRDVLADAKAALETSPQPSKPLTDAQIGAVAAEVWGSILIAPQSYQAFARAIEAKLKEKNNG